MKIAKTSVRKTFSKGIIKSVVSITLDDWISIHDIKVIQGHERLFVAMPNRFDDTGQSRDAVHSINYAAHETLEKMKPSAYKNYTVTDELTDYQ